MKPPVTARTRVAAVIGEPIRHSLSPTLHNAAFDALGLDWIYVAFEVAAGAAAAALDAARALDLGGLSVTMPHKTAIADACDELSEEARSLRSVNCLVPLGDGRWRGDSTDGAGFIRSLADAEVDLGSASALVLGAGGAARAVARALCHAGATVSLSARRADATRDAARAAGATVIGWSQRSDAARAADVVVNATPVGMGNDGMLPLDSNAISGHHVVADLVMYPLDTPLLVAARGAGAATVDGLGMLVHQAALAFQQWTGVEAPIAVMRAAALEMLH